MLCSVNYLDDLIVIDPFIDELVLAILAAGPAPEGGPISRSYKSR